MPILIITLVAILVTLHPVPAQVVLPFHDGFNYSAGANLAGNGNWVAGSGSTQIQVGATSLTYPGLQVSAGNEVTLNPTSSSARTYVSFTPQTANTLYVSFLLKINAAPSAQRLIAYAFNSTSSSSSPYLGFFATSSGQLAVGISTGTPQFTSAALGSGANLVVVGYTFGANDSARIWINPASLGGTEPAATGSFTAAGHNASLAHFHWNSPSAGTGGGSYELDELRIGVSYAEVTPAGGTPPIAAEPRVTEISLSNGHLVMRGTNGTPNASYHLLAAATLSAPWDQWSALATNRFDSNGQFAFTNPAAPQQPQQFYRLRSATGPDIGDAVAPSITSQPQNQSAMIGQGALFSIGASGTAPLSCQWFFNPNTALANQTNNTLLISNVQPEDAGEYFAVVSNNAGSVTSIVATLTLMEAPVDGDFFVSPTGNDANPGTLEAPFLSLQKAIAVAEPGNMIYMRGGTYAHSQTIRITNSGTLGSPIRIFAYPGEQPFLNFSTQPYGASNRGILITTSAKHWFIKGLEIGYAGDNGVKVEGSHIRIERCVFHHNGDSGLQIGFGHTDLNPGGSLAAFVEVVDCDSYLNFDPDSNGGDADGFAAKMHCGQGIVFQGCRAWENSDDGWDLFETDYSIVLTNCWTWKSGVAQGNGNGFKLGGNGTGGDSRGTHYAYNCVAFGHKVNGFTQNSHKDGLVLVNCLAFSNGTSGYNYFMEGSLNSGKQNVFKNNASLPRSGTNGGGFIEDNNPVQQNNSWNLAVTVNSADFVSLSETAAKAPRNPDGSLPTGFARLVAGSDLIDKGVDAGLPFHGAAPDLGAIEFVP